MEPIGIYTPQKERFDKISALFAIQAKELGYQLQLQHIWEKNLSNQLSGRILLVDICAQKDFSYLQTVCQSMQPPPFQVLLHDHTPIIITSELLNFPACLDLDSDLSHEISRLFEKFSEKFQVYVVKVKQHTSYFPIKDILYLEMEKHCVKLFTKQGSSKFWGTLDEEERRLTPMGFSRIHKSYIVNLRWIQKSYYSHLDLSSQISLPIGRKYRSIFESQYTEYLKMFNFC